MEPTPEEQAVTDEFGPLPPPVNGARVVRIATISCLAVFVAANTALVMSLAPRQVVGRSGMGMMMLTNFALMMLGCLSYLVVEQYARGASMRLYAALACAGPFLAYAIDGLILTRLGVG